MSLSDPIGDMLSRIKNSQMRNHKKVEMPSSNFKTKIADVLKSEGYINNFNVENSKNKNILTIDLKYNSGSPVISVIEREMYFLAITGLLSTVIAAFYYLRIIKIIYFDREKEKFDTQNNLALKISLFITTIFILFYFIFPSTLIQIVSRINVI